MGQHQSKPQLVISLEDDKPTHYPKAFIELMKRAPGNEFTTVHVIGVSGKCRLGKSFLLNLLKTYLDYYHDHETDEGWNFARDLAIEGWTWRDGRESVTHGIWMYMYPNLINGKAILLMDCQGTADLLHSNPTLDNLIILLALQLSDVHVLNVIRTFETEDLSCLNVCALHADDTETGNIFQRNFVLVRDWENDMPPMTLDELSEETTSKSVKQDIRGIKKAFANFDVEGLPHPGRKISRGAEEKGRKLGDVDEEFLDAALVFFRKLIFSVSLGTELNRREIFTKFKFLSHRTVGKVMTSSEAYAENVLKAICGKAKAEFERSIPEFERQVEDEPVTLPELQERITSFFDAVVEDFYRHPKVKNCEHPDIVDYYRKMIDDYYKSALETLECRWTLQQAKKALEEKKVAVELCRNKIKEEMEATERAEAKAADLRRKIAELKMAKEKERQKMAQERIKAESIALKAKACMEEALKKQRDAEAAQKRAKEVKIAAEAKYKKAVESSDDSCCTIQ